MKSLSITYAKGSTNMTKIKIEMENGDIMNDAIYTRTRAIEERLNVDLQHTLLESTAITEVPNTVKPTVLAGDDVYQQVLFHCIELPDRSHPTDR